MRFSHSESVSFTSGFGFMLLQAETITGPPLGPDLLLVLLQMFDPGVLLCLTEEKYEPSYYSLTDDETETKACLATGFSRHNESLFEGKYPDYNQTEPAQIFGDSLFNFVYLPPDNDTICKGLGK